jgi:hypothetical protein
MKLKPWLIMGALLIVFLIVGFKLTATDKEIEDAHQALMRARSYRANISVYVPSGAANYFTLAILCPDKMDLEQTGAHLDHIIRVGPNWWTNQINYPRWIQVPDPTTVPNPCTFGTDQPILFSNPLAKAMAIPAEFDRALRNHVDFTKGELRKIDNESCRNWTVEKIYTVCIRQSDHLPLDFTSRDQKVIVRFTDWNSNFEIISPQDLAVDPR